ncbi:MAG TPA: hypothetical protein VIO60_05020 [Rectinemataceae bacterium]
MVRELTATIGFGLLLAAELPGAHKLPLLGRAIPAVGYSLVGLGLAALAFPSVLPGRAYSGLPSPARPLLALAFCICAIICAILLLWTVFLEIGIERRKRGIDPGRAVRTGSYGICRHPGFWWLAFLVLFLCLRSGAAGGAPGAAAQSLGLAAILVGMDFILVLVQDIYSFPKAFSDYEDYKKSVPFLLPRIRPASGAGRIIGGPGKGTRS